MSERTYEIQMRELDKVERAVRSALLAMPKDAYKELGCSLDFIKRARAVLTEKHERQKARRKASEEAQG